MAESTGITVLHVDDDLAFADLTADMLAEQAGEFTVETATSASEGLNLLATTDFDCIVSDYAMPGQNGIEFLETVREEYPDLPFILYTGQGSEEVASDAIAAGATDYLQKGSGTDQYELLANRIQNAVDTAEVGEDVYKKRLRVAMQAGNVSWWEMQMPDGKTRFHDRKVEVLGYNPADFDHYEDFTSLIHPDDYDRVMDSMEAHLEGRAERYDVEYRIEARDGSYNWFHDVGGITERHDDGSPFIVSGLVIDITKRKQQEQQLLQEKERLEEFASVVSHDLRNPLTVAIGRAGALQDLCDDESQEHINEIVTSLERMDSIIEDTLTLARQGNTVGEMDPIPITSLVEQCWDGVETAGATLDLADEFMIRGDRDRLRHVFENLFRNAVEHAGDDVTIRVGRAGEDRFYVEDDGPGIPADDRKTVFEAGHSSATGGTGFGLTIVKRIAEAHDWEVSITDGRDGGARFEFDNVEVISE